MNRFRALAIKSSRRLGRPLNEAAGWWRSVRTAPVVPLASVRRRLELLLSAMYGVQFDIAPVDDDAPRNTFHLRKVRTVARHEGISIRLPSTMDAADSTDAAIARYRLLAIEQAARIVRGSAAHAPDNGDAAARDLYNLREGAEIDASIAASSPGVVRLIAEERKRALGARVSSWKLSEREKAVEQLVVRVLHSNPATIPDELRAGASPEESVAWAREQAQRVAALKGTYRSLPPVAVWGETLDSGGSAARTGPQYGALVPPSPGYGSGESAAPGGGADDSLQELTPFGPDAAKSAENGSDQDIEDGVEVPDGAPTNADAEHAAGGSERKGKSALNTTDAAILAASRSETGILYPEWDCNANAYRELGAVVHVESAEEGDATWADRVLGEHPAIVRRVRREFERLRARRSRLLRQREGDELDVAACVRALSDRMAGDSSDDRLYMAVRATRRPLAITVLVDISASTRDTVADGRRIIDVEKTTLLLASEAFDALGDSYSILAFASEGAPNVRVATVKGFHESNGETVRRRVASLESGGNTRLGAAIRHATAMLSDQAAGHRLLLILSDGKPNDVDRYFTAYATEDSRQAIFEARSDGVFPYCLLIDANDRDAYLERVFGTAGYSVLRRPEQLPSALLDLVRQLLRGGGR